MNECLNEGNYSNYTSCEYLRMMSTNYQAAKMREKICRLCILDCLQDNGTVPNLLCSSVYFQFFFHIFCSFRVVD